jgi:hypothetical protein
MNVLVIRAEHIARPQVADYKVHHFACMSSRNVKRLCHRSCLHPSQGEEPISEPISGTMQALSLFCGTAGAVHILQTLADVEVNRCFGGHVLELRAEWKQHLHRVAPGSIHIRRNKLLFFLNML